MDGRSYEGLAAIVIPEKVATMKLQKKLFCLRYGFLLLAISGCSPPQTPTGFATPSIPSDTTATVTFTPAPVTVSQTPTVVVAPLATIATVAVVPTLNADQAYGFLQNLIEGNPDCLLPCWGGVNPGVTSNTEAEIQLQPLSVLIYGGSIYPYRDREFLGPVSGGRELFFEGTKIDFVFGWSTQRGKNTVDLLILNANALNKDSEWAYGFKPYNQLFENYSLHNVLSQHGIPTQVWTIAEVYYDGDEEANPSLPEEFNLLLFYDKGILIRYTMPLIRNGDGKGKACPSDAFFNMMLVPSGTSRFYQGMLFSSITGSQDSSPYMPIEKSTQMTFDEFNQAFMESNSPCFETPLSIWPKH